MASDLFYRVSVDASGAGYDVSADLSSFTVEQRETQPDKLTVELADPYKLLSHALQEGMAIEAELGASDEHGVIFRGRLYKIDGTFPSDGAPRLTLQAYDNSMRMGLRRRNRVFSEATLSEIVTEVARASFTDLHIDIQGDPRFTGNGLRQQDETDLAFLLRLARTYGCIAYVRANDDGDTFNFISEESVMSSDPEVTLYYGRCDVPHRLLSFQASADASRIQLPRELSGIDYETGEAVEVTTAELATAAETEDSYFDENLTAFRGSDPLRAAQLELLIAAAGTVREELLTELGEREREATPTFTTEAEQQARAQNQFSTSRLGMRASGASYGIRNLMARTSVGVADVGGRFSGTWYLSQVRHILNREGYRTDFECRR